MTRKLVSVEAVHEAVARWIKSPCRNPRTYVPDEDRLDLAYAIDALPIEASVTDPLGDQPTRISFAPTEPPSPLTARVTPEMLQARELTLGLLDAIDEAMRKGDQLAAGEAFAELRCAWRDMPLPTAKAESEPPLVCLCPEVCSIHESPAEGPNAQIESRLRTIIAHPFLRLATRFNWTDEQLSIATQMIDITVIRILEHEHER